MTEIQRIKQKADNHFSHTDKPLRTDVFGVLYQVRKVVKALNESYDVELIGVIGDGIGLIELRRKGNAKRSHSEK